MSQQEAEAIEKELTSGSEFDASKTTINVQLLFRQAIFDAGISRQDGKVEGVRVFAKDISANFTQYPSQEMTFDLGSQISDFGVDLYIFNPENSNYQMQDSIITSNKKIMA